MPSQTAPPSPSASAAPSPRPGRPLLCAPGTSLASPEPDRDAARPTLSPQGARRRVPPRSGRCRAGTRESQRCFWNSVRTICRARGRPGPPSPAAPVLQPHWDGHRCPPGVRSSHPAKGSTRVMGRPAAPWALGPGPLASLGSSSCGSHPKGGGSRISTKTHISWGEFLSHHLYLCLQPRLPPRPTQAQGVGGERV